MGEDAVLVVLARKTGSFYGCVYRVLPSLTSAVP